MNLLEQLRGQTLCSVSKAHGSKAHGTQSFFFSAGVIAAYTPVSSSQSLESLVGLKVVAVTHAVEEALTVDFEHGAQLAISLRREDHVGPEAFSAKFNSVLVVE